MVLPPFAHREAETVRSEVGNTRQIQIESGVGKCHRDEAEPGRLDEPAESLGALGAEIEEVVCDDRQPAAVVAHEALEQRQNFVDRRLRYAVRTDDDEIPLLGGTGGVRDQGGKAIASEVGGGGDRP